MQLRMQYGTVCSPSGSNRYRYATPNATPAISSTARKPRCRPAYRIMAGRAAAALRPHRVTAGAGGSLPISTATTSTSRGPYGWASGFQQGRRGRRSLRDAANLENEGARACDFDHDREDGD